MAEPVTRCLSPRRPVLDLRLISVRFVLDRVAVGQVCHRALRLYSLTFHQCSVLRFIYTLLLSEEQTDEAWGLSKNHFSFGNIR